MEFSTSQRKRLPRCVMALDRLAAHRTNAPLDRLEILGAKAVTLCLEAR